MHRRIIALERKEKLRQVVQSALNDYAVDGKMLEDFEEDYGCMIIFDECQIKSITGIDGIWFRNQSSKTAFMLRYDV